MSKSVNDVAIYSVLGIVFLLSFRSISDKPRNVQIVDRAGHTQTGQAESRTVSVTGSADMLVPPDKITVSVAYQEYWTGEVGKNKLSIEAIEKRVVKAAKKAGIAPKNIVLDTISSWRHNWNYWSYWYGRSNLLMQRSLTLELRDTAQLQDLIERLKDQSIRKEGIVGITLSGSSNSKLQDYRKQVKERAMLAAQEKAAYLLASVGERRGRLVHVSESKDPESRPNPYYYGWGAYAHNQSNFGLSNATISVPYNPSSSSTDEMSMKPIRLQYMIEATFEIAGASS